MTILRAGGLAAFVRRTELDSAALPADAVDTLRELVDRLTADLPAPAPSAPDELRYELIVDDGGMTSTRRPTEETLSESERLLIAFVDGRAERADTVVPL